MNKEYLTRVGITHVLNTAEGCNFATVNTNAEYYSEVGIKYLGLQLLDVPSANISQFFEQGADFIESCLSSGGLCFTIAYPIFFHVKPFAYLSFLSSVLKFLLPYYFQ